MASRNASCHDYDRLMGTALLLVPVTVRPAVQLSVLPGDKTLVRRKLRVGGGGLKYFRHVNQVSINVNSKIMSHVVMLERT